MKIIKRKSDNVVLYIGDDLSIDVQAVYGDGWVDRNYNDTTADLVEAQPPANFVGTAFAFDGHTWNIVNPAIVPAPTAISPFQAKAALLNAGLLDSVTTLMAKPDTPKLAVLAWNEATEFRRDSPTVAAIGAALGMTSAQVDALFIAAVGLVA